MFKEKKKRLINGIKFSVNGTEKNLLEINVEVAAT